MTNLMPMSSPRPIAPVFSFAAATVLATTLWAQTPTPPAPAGNPVPAAATQEPAAAKKPARLDEKLFDHFGDGIVEGPAVEVAEALKNPDQFTGKTVRLTGAITGVCQTKGCWMHLGSEATPMMVKFKDYAFFVPKDASGRTAIVEGGMKWKQETVEETRHYLEDAGRKEEAAKITEGRRIVTFLASGVALTKPSR